MDDPFGFITFLARVILAIGLVLAVIVVPAVLFSYRERKYCHHCGRKLEKVFYPLTYNEYTGKPEKESYWLMCPVCDANQPVPPKGG